MDEHGRFSSPKAVPMTLEMPPVLLETITRESWLESVKQLKVIYPALGVVGLTAAKKLMRRAPDVPVQFDTGSGFVSSIGLNIQKYRDAEYQGWDPKNGRIVPARLISPISPTSPAQPAPPTQGKRPATALPVVVPAKAPKTAAAHEAPGRRDPPSEVHKLLRTAARCPPLIKYLKRESHYAHMNEGQWRCIRRWCETADGVNWLKTAGLDPLSFHLHHVKAKESGGHYSVFNCVFAPASANSWWGSLDTAHMREFIGEEACKLSDRHAKWCAAQAAKGLDQSKFNPDFD